MVSLLTDIKTILTGMATNLDDLNFNFQEVISIANPGFGNSYMRVQLQTDTIAGQLAEPIPATVATGLLVSAYAASDTPIQVTGTVSTGNQPIDVNVPDPIAVRPQFKDAWSGSWKDALGFNPDNTTYVVGDVGNVGSESGSVQLLAVTGVNPAGDGAQLNVINAADQAVGTAYSAMTLYNTNVPYS